MITRSMARRTAAAAVTTPPPSPTTSSPSSSSDDEADELVGAMMLLDFYDRARATTESEVAAARALADKVIEVLKDEARMARLLAAAETGDDRLPTIMAVPHGMSMRARELAAIYVNERMPRGVRVSCTAYSVFARFP